MKTSKWVLLGALLLPPLALATGNPKMLTTPPIKVRVQVDATGHLTHITPMRKLKEPFAGIVERTLAKWTFYPARVNDKPVVTTTWLNIALKARMEVNGDAQVQVQYLGNGPDVAPLVGPAYPRTMLRRYCEAEVVVQATVGANGHLANPRVLAAMTTHGDPAADFVHAAFDAVNQTRASPIIVDGQPVPTQIRFPITFNIGTVGKVPAGLECASDSAKFVHSAPAAITPADLSSDASVVLDSPIQPLTTPGG